jgi:class 3 adenylate cyclase/tetratricopeptide (TPR) repeat protein
MTGREGPEPIRGERRAVTVLFADLSNFTKLGEQLDPEDVASLIRECFREVIHEIRTLDGWLEKHIGDAVLAVFGAPIAHEDDPERAVRAALAIRDRIAALNERIGDRVGEPLNVHVGINTGLVVVSPAVENSDGDEFIVVGDTVSTAARLQQAAGPGQILVGERTRAATEWRYAYERLAPLKLKGKRDRVAAWACLGPHASDGGRAPVGRGGGSRVVGRSREQAILENCVEHLAGGRGGLVLLTGDPGIGKTRLLGEARLQAEERGVLWLEGRTISFGEHVAYAPFVDVLNELAGIDAEDDDRAAWQKLERRLRELLAGEEATELAPYLAMLLEIELPTAVATSVRYLEGEGAGLQIFRATRRVCERLARRQPVVLAFEDWHWADETSAELLEHLLPLAASVPVLFCCSSRSERSPVPALLRTAAELRLDDRVVRLELEPLSPAAANELVVNLAEGRALPTHLSAQIVETTEGNPFFIEEIVASLLEGEQQREQLQIPETLRGAITARVDRLRGETADVLRIASVLGRGFSHRLLVELAPGMDVDAALAELDEADLVRAAGAVQERQYTFKHAVTQEVVYENVLLAERRELHRRVALMLEEVFADRLDELAGTVAFHYTQAEDWPRAQSFLFRAGDHAGSIAASAEVLTYYGKALEAYSRAAGSELDPQQRAGLDRKIGEAFFRRGEHDKATEYLERALACLGFGYPETRKGVRLAIARAAATQFTHRKLRSRRYGSISDEPDPWMDELSRILDTLGWIFFFSDPERVVFDSLRQLNTAEERGHRLAVVRASTGLGFVFDAIPVRSIAENYHRRAVDLSARLGNRRSVGIAYLGLAHHQRYQLAALDEALENYGRAAEECRRAGDIRSRMGATLMLAEVTGLRGDLAASLGHGRSLIEVGEDAGDSQVQGWGHLAVGRTLYQAGELAEARLHLERACELSERVPDFQALLVARGNLGLALLEQGELTAAMGVLEPTYQFAEERRLRTFACTDMLKGLAKAYLALAERAEGAERDGLLRSAKQACRGLARQVKLDRAAEPAALRLEGTRQWLRRKPRKARDVWGRSITAATTLSLPQELAWSRLELGERTADPALVSLGRAQLDGLSLAGDTTAGDHEVLTV